MSIQVPKLSLFPSVICFLLVSIRLCLAVETPSNPPQKAMGDVKLEDLDLSQLIVAISGWPQDSKKLQMRAVERLINAGIYQPSESTAPSHTRPRLILTFRTFPLRDCPGKELYQASIELLEEIRLKRDPNLFIIGRTWHKETIGVVNVVRYEKLEADLDEFVDQFILEYKLRNPG